MKKVYITPENKELIEKMCDDLHKGCSNHLLDYRQIVGASKCYEDLLSDFLKKHHKYLQYFFSTSEGKAKAYKYSYKADDVVLAKDKKGIYIKQLSRGTYWPNNPHANLLIISCKAEEKEEVTKDLKEYLFRKWF